MAGCYFSKGEKNWGSIYIKPRHLLFITIFFMLHIPWKAFTEFKLAGEYPLTEVLMRSVFVVIMLWIIFRFAMGYFRWSIAIFIILFGQMGVSFFHPWPDTLYFNVALAFAALQAGLIVATLFLYRERVNNVQDLESKGTNELSP